MPARLPPRTARPPPSSYAFFGHPQPKEDVSRRAMDVEELQREARKQTSELQAIFLTESEEVKLHELRQTRGNLEREVQLKRQAVESIEKSLREAEQDDFDGPRPLDGEPEERKIFGSDQPVCARCPMLTAQLQHLDFQVPELKKRVIAEEKRKVVIASERIQRQKDLYDVGVEHSHLQLRLTEEKRKGVALQEELKKTHKTTLAMARLRIGNEGNKCATEALVQYLQYIHAENARHQAHFDSAGRPPIDPLRHKELVEMARTRQRMSKILNKVEVNMQDRLDQCLKLGRGFAEVRRLLDAAQANWWSTGRYRGGGAKEAGTVSTAQFGDLPLPPKAIRDVVDRAEAVLRLHQRTAAGVLAILQQCQIDSWRDSVKTDVISDESSKVRSKSQLFSRANSRKDMAALARAAAGSDSD